MKHNLVLATSILFSLHAVQPTLEVIEFSRNDSYTAIITSPQTSSEHISPCLIDPSYNVALSGLRKNELIGCIISVLSQSILLTQNEHVRILITAPEDCRYNLAEEIYSQLLICGIQPTILLIGAEHEFNTPFISFLKTSEAVYSFIGSTPYQERERYTKPNVLVRSDKTLGNFATIVVELSPLMCKEYASICLSFGKHHESSGHDLLELFLRYRQESDDKMIEEIAEQESQSTPELEVGEDYPTTHLLEKRRKLLE